MSRHLLWNVLLFTLAVSLFFPFLLQAEVTGTISGTVTDSSGAAIGNIVVSLNNTDTGLVRNVKTDAGGRYEFLSVPVGENYSVKVQAPGFQTSTQNAIKLDVNQKYRRTSVSRSEPLTR